MTTTLSTTTAEATRWITEGRNQTRELRFETPETSYATIRAITTRTIGRSENGSDLALPLYYARNEEGKWEAHTPHGKDNKIKGMLKARATLTLGKMNQIDRMRAKLEARKNV
jgi:hypothetical protein